MKKGAFMRHDTLDPIDIYGWKISMYRRDRVRIISSIYKNPMIPEEERMMLEFQMRSGWSTLGFCRTDVVNLSSGGIHEKKG